MPTPLNYFHIFSSGQVGRWRGLDSLAERLKIIVGGGDAAKRFLGLDVESSVMKTRREIKHIIGISRGEKKFRIGLEAGGQLLHPLESIIESCWHRGERSKGTVSAASAAMASQAALPRAAARKTRAAV